MYKQPLVNYTLQTLDRTGEPVFRYIRLVSLLILLLLFACADRDRYDSISDSDKLFLEEQALVYARYWTLPPDSLEDPVPNQNIEDILIEMFEDNPATGAYFYECVNDSVAELEPPEPECRR